MSIATKCCISLAFILIFIPYITMGQLRPGRYIFDDFDYNSIEYPVSSIPSGSMYGKNMWLTDSGYKPLLAWVRWNIGFPKYGDKAGLRLAPEGFALEMKPGCLKNDLFPVTHSTFHLKHGTFVSRVKFGYFHPEDMITHAYWLMSPIAMAFFKGSERIQYNEEIDFEWNNWWKHQGTHLMSVGCNNKNYQNPIQHDLECIYKHNNEMLPCGCNDMINGTHAVAEQWGIYFFEIDTLQETIKIYFHIDNFNGTGDEIWGGSLSDPEMWGKPYTIYNYKVEYDMIVMYSMGLTAEPLNNYTAMEVDWFCYIPQTNLKYTDVEEFVKNLKKVGLTRVNKMCVEFDDSFESWDKSDLCLYGPQTALANLDNKWLIQTNYFRWGNYYLNFKYRLHRKDGCYDDWINCYCNELHVKPSDVYDSLEVYLIYKDMWSTYADTINYTIPVVENGWSKPEGMISDLKAYPNPVTDVFLISYLLNKDSDISLELFDLEGSKLTTIISGDKQKGNYVHEISTSKYAPGVYYLLLKCDGNIEHRTQVVIN